MKLLNSINLINRALSKANWELSLREQSYSALLKTKRFDAVYSLIQNKEEVSKLVETAYAINMSLYSGKVMSSDRNEWLSLKSQVKKFSTKVHCLHGKMVSFLTSLATIEAEKNKEPQPPFVGNLIAMTDAQQVSQGWTFCKTQTEDKITRVALYYKINLMSVTVSSQLPRLATDDCEKNKPYNPVLSNSNLCIWIRCTQAVKSGCVISPKHYIRFPEKTYHLSYGYHNAEAPTSMEYTLYGDNAQNIYNSLPLPSGRVGMVPTMNNNRYKRVTWGS